MQPSTPRKRGTATNAWFKSPAKNKLSPPQQPGEGIRRNQIRITRMGPKIRSDGVMPDAPHLVATRIIAARTNVLLHQEKFTIGNALDAELKHTQNPLQALGNLRQGISFGKLPFTFELTHVHHAQPLSPLAQQLEQVSIALAQQHQQGVSAAMIIEWAIARVKSSLEEL